MNFEKILYFLTVLVISVDGAKSIDTPVNDSLSPFKKSTLAVVHMGCETGNDSTSISCIGTIVNEFHVLTTADCVMKFVRKNEDFCRIVVHADEQHVAVDQVLVHPKSSEFRESLKYNVALLRLTKSIKSDKLQSSSINRVSISPETFPESAIEQKTTFVVAVYVDEFNSLNMNDEKVMIVTVNNLKCNKWNLHDAGCYTIIKPKHIDSCKHLQEKPMFVWANSQWEQIGITSEFVEDINSSCTGVYNPLTWSYSWINSFVDYYKKTESFDSESDESTIYECDRWSYCGCSNAANVTINHQKNATEEAAPYSWSMIVSIRIGNTNDHACTGTLLTNYDVLTSAHCVHQVKPSEISIVYGIHNLVDDWNFPRFAWSVKIHPDWNSTAQNDANDIAIVSLFIPIPIATTVPSSRTCIPDLPEASNLSEYPSIDARLVIVGWKSVTNDQTTSSNVLQQATTYVVDNQDSSCQQSTFDRNKQICVNTLSNNRCYGDIGSPVFQWHGSYWEQVGMITSNEFCNNSQPRAVFIRLAHYFNWIESNVEVPLTTSPPTTTTRAPRPPPYTCDRNLKCGCSKNNVELTKSRIVGGEEAIDDSWTMIVYLRDDSREVFCSGTILSESFILTAAHCVRSYSFICPSNLWIVAGVTNRSDSRQISRKVNQIYLHPNYNASSSERRNDIAILRLNDPLVLDNERQITRTCINPLSTSIPVTEYPQAGTRLAIAGWGSLRYSSTYLPEILQQAEVFMVDNNNSLCRNLTYFQEGQMCAGLSEGGKDACQGDSGGGIFMWTGAYWEQVGIVSFGRNCALPDTPGIYTRLPIYYSWIVNILDLYEEHVEPKPDSSKLFKHYLNGSFQQKKKLVDECEITSTTSSTSFPTNTTSFTSAIVSSSTSSTSVTGTTTHDSSYQSSTTYSSSTVYTVTPPPSNANNFYSALHNEWIEKLLLLYLATIAFSYS